MIRTIIIALVLFGCISSKTAEDSKINHVGAPQAEELLGMYLSPNKQDTLWIFEKDSTQYYQIREQLTPWRWWKRSNLWEYSTDTNSIVPSSYGFLKLHETSKYYDVEYWRGGCLVTYVNDSILLYSQIQDGYELLFRKQ